MNRKQLIIANFAARLVFSSYVAIAKTVNEVGALVNNR
jgi:hypothetical protein